LGLISCKNIVEMHGGKITVSSNPSIFTVVLPKNSH
ncbi:MAG: sensor histidine kinase, partial [Nitrosopumilaceae archaeon]|nr:sensor histidine kinase [Nitrosopumilaceae archaeon]